MSHISYLTNCLDLKTSEDRREMKEIIDKGYHVINHNRNAQLFQLIREKNEMEKNRSMDSQQNFMKYLDNERLILDADLDRKLKEIKNMETDTNMDDLTTEEKEILQIEEEAGDEDQDLFQNVIQEQSELMSLIIDFDSKKAEYDRQITAKQEIITNLDLKLKDFQNQIERMSQENENCRQIEKEKQALIKKYKEKKEMVQENKVVGDLLYEIDNLQAKLSNANQNLKEIQKENKEWETKKMNYEQLSKEQFDKNKELRHRLAILGQMLKGKMKDLEVLVYENTRLRKDIYLSQGQVIDPLDVLSSKGKEINEQLYLEIKGMLQKNRKLEEKIIEIEIQSKKKLEKLNLAKRESFLDQKVEADLLKKVKTETKPTFGLFGSSNFKPKETDIKNTGINQFKNVAKEVKQELFTKEIENLVKENAKIKLELEQSLATQAEQKEKISFLEQEKTPSNLKKTNSVESLKEINQNIHKLLEAEKETKESILNRHEQNLNKFISRLESKLQLPAKKAEEKIKIEGTETEKIENLDTQTTSRPFTMKKIGYQEFFDLMVRGQKEDLTWGNLENTLLDRVKKFKENPIHRLSDRQIFFIDSPYYFLEKILQENKELLLEIKEMESKMRAIVENNELRNVIQENEKLWAKLIEFKKEKKEIDSIKEVLREVYSKIKGEEEADVEKMTEYFENILKKNSEMKADLIKEKQAKLEKVVWNVDVMRKRLKIQEKGEIIENLHKNMENKLQKIEKQLKALELVVSEDVSCMEGDKQIKRDMLTKLVEVVREDLVSKMEEGMKGVTQYVQEVMRGGANLKEARELKKLRQLVIDLEAQAKLDQESNLSLNGKLLEIGEEVKRLQKENESAKDELIRFRKREAEAEEFCEKIEEIKPIAIDEEEEKLSTCSDKPMKSESGATSKREKKMQRLLLKYQAMLVGIQKMEPKE